MQARIKFSSKRFLLALMLCACSIILLQNDDLAADTSFTFQLLGILGGLSVCFVLFLPSLFIKIRTDGDVLQLAERCTPRAKLPLAAVYSCCFVYTALYFLLPYTEMFHTKYFPEASPCLITVVLLACCVYAACKGVNVISRFGVFLFAFALLTNILMFGGSVSEVDWGHCTFALRGDAGEFLQNTVYFVTPAFIIPIFACLSGCVSNFRLRQPVFALVFTGIKYAAVIFFICFALGDYSRRQGFQTFLLSRVAHFSTFAGIESFYLALSTMAVFMILSLLLCCITKSVGRSGELRPIILFTGIILALDVAATYLDPVREVLTNPLLFVVLTVIPAAVIPMIWYFIGRKSNEPKN